MDSRTLPLIIGALLGSAAGAGLPAKANLDQEFHQAYTLSAHGRVSLENINGNVRITAWDRNEVKVDAVKRGATRERLGDARIVVDSGPDFISIKTRYDEPNSDNHPARVEYTLMVPRDARLDEIRLINGALEIDGVTGDVKASSVNGTVRAQKLASDAQLSTINGRLEAAFDRLDAAKTISLHSVNGSILLSLPYDARADLKASNVSGGISNDFGLPVDRGRFIGSRLSAVLKGGGTHVRLNNVNGGISIVPVAHGRRVRFT